MKKIFLMLMTAAALSAACSKTPEPAPKPDPSQEPAPVTSDDPSPDPSAGPEVPVIVEGKVILNGKTGFETFAAALEAARTAGEEAVFTLSSGTLAENILLSGEDVNFPVSIIGKTGAVLDGSIEIKQVAVSLKNFSIIPDKVQPEKPAIEIKDRNNYPFAVFVHDAKYGFSMEGVTLDVSRMNENTTAVVLRGETIGEGEADVVRGCTFKGAGQRMMQLYDAQAEILGNQFEDFYSKYAIRVGEDIGDEAYYANESGPVLTFAGNTFSSASAACINFYSLWTSEITFGNGEEDTNVKGDNVATYYTVDQVPGADCIWHPEMVAEGGELFPASLVAMPEAELVWAKRAEDGWWSTAPLPGLGGDWNRSVAMDDHYVYMPRQKGGETEVFYFPITDPSQVKTLDMTGVTTDATHTVSGCQVVDDGNGGTALLVCNLARNRQELKVYKWTSVTSAPEVLLTYNVGHPTNMDASARLGDKMTFNGTLQDGEIVFVNYDVGGRFWIFPVKGGKTEVPEGYFGENGWTSDYHKASNIVGATRFLDTDAYVLWGANLTTTVTSIWGRSPDGLSFAGQFPGYLGMFDPQFFAFGRSKYLAYTSLTDSVDNKYYSTIRIVKILPNADGNDSLYVTLSTTPSDGGLVLGIGQASAEVPVLDVNPNGNMVGGCAVRQVGNTTYVLGSDTNNALVLYRLK